MNTSPTDNRRTFLRKATAGVVASAAAVNLLPSLARKALAETIQDAPTASSSGKPPMRILGKTGLAVTEISVGAMNCSDPAVLRRAFDLGVNYVDTAHCYMGPGVNEGVVRRAVKGIRDKVIIATKSHHDSADKMVASVEESLKALGTDYIDIIQVHGVSSPQDIHHEGTLEASRRLKKSGKVRFNAVTAHSNMAAILNELADTQNYDTALVSYNFSLAGDKDLAAALEKAGRAKEIQKAAESAGSDEERKAAVAEARKTAIGIVAMKTQQGGYKVEGLAISPHQAALRWVLRNPNVATCVPGITSIQQAEENFEAMSKAFALGDRMALAAYANATDRLYCRSCSGCDGMCPDCVLVPDVNRCLMYAEGYGNLDLARNEYAKLPAERTATRCGDCRRCRVRCHYGLDVRAKMMQARRIFA